MTLGHLTCVANVSMVGQFWGFDRQQLLDGLPQNAFLQVNNAERSTLAPLLWVLCPLSRPGAGRHLKAGCRQRAAPLFFASGDTSVSEPGSTRHLCHQDTHELVMSTLAL